MPTRAPRLALWLALVAMLALALLPTVSHALAFARGGAAWAELCTPQGVRLVAVDAAQALDDAPLPAQAAGHLEHCPLCALGANAPLLPAVATPLALPAHRVEMPALFLHAPRTLFAWRSAQPRGPPSNS